MSKVGGERDGRTKVTCAADRTFTAAADAAAAAEEEEIIVSEVRSSTATICGKRAREGARAWPCQGPLSASLRRRTHKTRWYSRHQKQQR